LHTCCCIVFECLDSNLCLNSFYWIVFSKIENPFHPLFLFACAAHRSKSGGGPPTPPPVRSCTPPHLGPARPSVQRRPICASAAARWGPRVIPHLAPCPGRTRGPTPSLRRARPRVWPRAHLPGRPRPFKGRRHPRLRRLRTYPNRAHAARRQTLAPRRRRARTVRCSTATVKAARDVAAR
jgi:hypothetical protein